VIPVTAIVSIVTFLVALRQFRVVSIARRSLATARATGAAVRDPSLDDRARERAAQQGATSMAVACVSLVVRSFLAASLSFLPIWIADRSGVAGTALVVAYLSRWQTALQASGLGVVAYACRVRLWTAS
jgi:hypothetical protein